MPICRVWLKTWRGAKRGRSSFSGWLAFDQSRRGRNSRAWAWAMAFAGQLMDFGPDAQLGRIHEYIFQLGADSDDGRLPWIRFQKDTTLQILRYECLKGAHHVRKKNRTSSRAKVANVRGTNLGKAGCRPGWGLSSLRNGEANEVDSVGPRSWLPTYWRGRCIDAILIGRGSQDPTMYE